MDKNNLAKAALVAMILGAFLLVLHLYYHCYGFLRGIGMTNIHVDVFVAHLRKGDALRNPFLLKGLSGLLGALGMVAAREKPTDKPWWEIALLGAVGAGLYFCIPGRGPVYLGSVVFGYCCVLISSALSFRKLGLGMGAMEDENDSFPQNEKVIEDKYSINFRTKYQWHSQIRTGSISIVNVFRGVMVMGTPGAGKSYSVINQFIIQMIRKGYAMCIYDYKYDDLTRIAYNALLENVDAYPVKPKFYVLNFDDPEHSFRCNPLNPKLLTDPADSTEIAEIIMLNINKRAKDREDFFSMSAKVYLDALIWFLKIYEDGKYCTLPHVIELMSLDYKRLFKVLQMYPELDAKLRPFANALDAKAQDQLQGQIASAQIPLTNFISKSLYWTLSGDDFGLDINNPDEPKIICIGNSPQRDSTYGTSIAVLMTRMFKIINAKNKQHCGIILDELPTVFLKGLDKLIATARSNYVGIVLGAQDKSQLVRDYGDKEASVIVNTVGNLFVGQVNGRTAEETSKSFGKRLKKMQSHTEGTHSESTSESYQLQDVLPASKIEAFSQGEFCGKMADSIHHRIEKKFFWGNIEVEDGYDEWEANLKPIPHLTFFQDVSFSEAVEMN